MRLLLSQATYEVDAGRDTGAVRVAVVVTVMTVVVVELGNRVAVAVVVSLV